MVGFNIVELVHGSLINSGERTGLPKFEKGNPYRFKPGVSGNPKGRPKNKTLEEIVLGVLDETVAGPEGGEVSKMEILSRVVVDKAIRDRDIATIALLAKRIWPEVNRHEVSGSLGLEQQVHDAAKELDRLLGINEDDDAAESTTDHPLQ